MMKKSGKKEILLLFLLDIVPYIVVKKQFVNKGISTKKCLATQVV